MIQSADLDHSDGPRETRESPDALDVVHSPLLVIVHSEETQWLPVVLKTSFVLRQYTTVLNVHAIAQTAPLVLVENGWGRCMSMSWVCPHEPTNPPCMMDHEVHHEVV